MERFTSLTTVDSDDGWVRAVDLVVMTRRYDKAGTLVSSYTLSTVLASQVVADLLGRTQFGSLLLPQYDGANATVEATTYAIEHLVFYEGATPAEILDALIALEPDFYWAVWEDTANAKARFEWRAWPLTVRYEATAQGGVELPGSSFDLYNAVNVRWKDANGRIRFRRRTQTVEELDDAGLTREAFLDLTVEAGTQTDADKAGDQFLAEHQDIRAAGTLRVSSAIFDHDRGQMVEPYELRPGHLIRVRDIVPRLSALTATERDGISVFRVVAVDYDARRNEASLTLDAEQRQLAQMVGPVRVPTRAGVR